MDATMASLENLTKLTELRINLQLYDASWYEPLKIEFQIPLPLFPCKLSVLEVTLPWYHDTSHVAKVRSLLNQQNSLTSLDLTLDAGQRWDTCEVALRKSASTIQHLTLGVSDQQDIQARDDLWPFFVWNKETRSFDWNILLGSKLASLELLVFDDLRRTLRTENLTVLQLKHLRRLKLHFIQLKNKDLSHIALTAVSLRELNLKCWSGDPWTVAQPYTVENSTLLTILTNTLLSQRLEILELEDNCFTLCPSHILRTLKDVASSAGYTFKATKQQYDRRDRQLRLHEALNRPIPWQFYQDTTSSEFLDRALFGFPRMAWSFQGFL
jgi:hypothetical protein